jgi:hypothetical protein
MDPWIFHSLWRLWKADRVRKEYHLDIPWPLMQESVCLWEAVCNWWPTNLSRWMHRLAFGLQILALELACEALWRDCLAFRVCSGPCSPKLSACLDLFVALLEAQGRASERSPGEVSATPGVGGGGYSLGNSVA